MDATLTPISIDLETDLNGVVEKCRALSKNNPIIRAYLSSCVKNVVGKTGFELQCQVKQQDNMLDQALNDTIEWAWYDFGKAMNGFLTIDGGMRTQGL